MNNFIKRIYSLPLLSGLLILLLVAAGSVELKEFSAQISTKNNTEVVVNWVVEEDSEGMVYVLKRKLSHEDDFTPLTQLDHEQGEFSMNGRSYSFTDSNVFKGNQSSDAVIYALYTKDNSGSNSLTFLSQANVNVTTTAVRKTWGSIKAMFQR
jgi:hypothetical protein